MTHEGEAGGSMLQPGVTGSDDITQNPEPVKRKWKCTSMPQPGFDDVTQNPEPVRHKQQCTEVEGDLKAPCKKHVEYIPIMDTP